MEADNQIIFGRKPVLEAIKSGEEIDKVLVIQSLRGEFEVELRKLSKTFDFTIQRVPQEKLNRLSRNHTHQGIIAYLSPISYHKLENLLPNLLASKNDPILLMVDGIEDVRNFGAIGRSALAFNVDGIISFAKGNARVNDIAIKTSAGALLKIPVCREEKLEETLSFLSSSGIKIFASSLSANEYLSDLDSSGPIAIVMGSEETGVSKLTQDYADQLFKLKQSPKMESLNVSVAAGIILHQIYAKRNEN